MKLMLMAVAVGCVGAGAMAAEHDYYKHLRYPSKLVPGVPLEPPLTFGSHRSKLVEQIRKEPCKAGLTQEEFIKIVTWIDANAPFYGTHKGKKNIKWKDDPDFRPLPRPPLVKR